MKGPQRLIPAFLSLLLATAAAGQMIPIAPADDRQPASDGTSILLNAEVAPMSGVSLRDLPASTLTRTSMPPDLEPIDRSGWRTAEPASKAVAEAGKITPANNGLELEGNITYSLTGSSMVLTADRVSNNRTGGISGTLRLELWATTTIPVFGGTINYYGFGGFNLGQLAAGNYYYNISSGTIAATRPPRGTYYLTMVLLEYEGGEFRYNDLRTFSTPETFDVMMRGNVAYTYQGSQARLTAEKVENSANGKTGTLRLELWAFPQPFSPGANGYSLARHSLGQLDSGYEFNNIDSGTIAFSPPPNGTYYLTMFLTEFQAGGTYNWVDYLNFPDPKTFGSTAPPVISSFTASPSTLNGAGSTTLSWTSTGGTSASISGIGAVATSGNVTISVSATTTYTLTVTGPGGSVSRSVTVNVSGGGGSGGCVPSPTRFCLNNNRFEVSVNWSANNQNGAGTGIKLTNDTGYFWFFNSANIELVVKVLDGRGLNGKFWVFYGSLSNVEYTLTLRDTITGVVKAYKNPSGQFASVGDTSAF